ncbi:MAG: UDP-N-acetylglucosamine 2-epimerase (hydrolyzing) [Eubacterium sp.]|nr:UDP-N-acetylglucosamine 2-epimerase (hydrolyzing) [Eubacterium sp.]
MKKICVVTATRAEYGPLKRTIQRVLADQELELCLTVTGTHLSEAHGYTVEEIEKDGIPIAEKINILQKEDGETEICKTMGQAACLFGKMFERQKPDLLLVCGDRYELLPICSSAMVFGIPIAHISGGEVTEGAIDDTIRHCITKMSYLHFPGCEEYRQRIIQLGEAPERVFNFGDVGVENIRKTDYLSRRELEKSLGISFTEKLAGVTFHPVTLERDSAAKQTVELISVLRGYPEITFVVTMANADFEGQVINRMFEESAAKYGNIHCYASLGAQRYLSLLKHADFVIGNSSSGIIEAPCFGIPTINIGNRQKGRLKAESVIDCEAAETSVRAAVEQALTPEFQEIARNAKNPYGDGDTSERIVETIKEFLEQGKIDLKKRFYDLEAVKK